MEDIEIKLKIGYKNIENSAAKFKISMNRKMNIPLQICVHVCKHTWLSVYVIDNICIYFAYSKNFHISKFFVYPKTGRQTTANNHNCEKRGNNFTRYFWKLNDERVIGYVCEEH